MKLDSAQAFLVCFDMAPHLTLFFVLLTLPAGVAAVSTVLQLRKRAAGALFQLFAVVLGVFTLSVLEFYVFSYVRTNLGVPGRGFLLVWGVLDSLTDMAVVFTGLLFFHELYRLSRKRLLNHLIAAAALIATALTIGSVLLSHWDFNPGNVPAGVVLGLAIYYLLFLWMIVLNLFRIWRLEEVTERFLGWALFVFALTGIAEAVVSALEMREHASDSILPHGFYISTIPWFVICVASIFILPRLVRPASEVSHADVLDRFASRHNLSEREREVLELLLSGMDNRAIADRLFVSLPTIKSHVHSILQKTHCRGRFELSTLVRSDPA